MSTTEIGQICQEVYDPTTQIPYVPAACTAYTNATPGALTGTSGVEVTWVQATKPANALGKNGYIDITMWPRNENSAGAKQYILTYGATDFYTPTLTTETGNLYRVRQQNRGVANSQNGYAFPEGATVTTTTASAIDDASAQTVYVKLYQNTATSCAGMHMLDIKFSGASQ